jgi:ABC-type arginine/histidine transport system permease subunit
MIVPMKPLDLFSFSRESWACTIFAITLHASYIGKE